MKRLWIVLGALLLIAAGVARPLSAQLERQLGGVGLQVFEDADYRGRSATFTRNVSNLESSGLNDRISSLRVGRGERWEVCEHASYRGRCEIVSGNEPNLSRNGWSDIISSVRRLDDIETPGRGRGAGPRDGVELFAGTRWTGQRLAVTAQISNLERNQFNDRANSIRVAPGERWEVCVDANYSNCREVSSDMTDLDQIGMARNISSLRQIGFGRGGGGRGGNSPQLIFFADTNYRGRSMTIGDNRASLGDFANVAQSVQVISGRWEVCDQVLYRGNCQTISSSIPDLRRIGMLNRISSARER